MNITLSIDEKVVSRVRKKAAERGSSLNQMVRDYLQTEAVEDGVEEQIAEFNRLSGQGDSNGWKFDRDEIHERTQHERPR